MLKKMTKLTLVAVSAFYLSGCASPAKPLNMTVFRETPPTLNTPLEKNMSVENISGGQATNPLWTSKVSNESFQTALRDSLKQCNLLSEKSDAGYKLSANLVSLKQPMIGITLKVLATVSYTLTEVDTGKDIWSKTIATEGKATMGDSFFAVARLRMANENAIKNNIKMFIDKVISADIKSKKINV